MILMLRRCAQLFFVVFMFVSFLEIASAHSDFLAHSHSETQEQALHLHDDSASTETDRHCPAEAIHHCCHLNFILKIDAIGLTNFIAGPQVFVDLNLLVKPFPFLDGPFQPPRT